MASILVLLIQLSSMGSLVSASHYYGGSMTFTARGKNPDGSYRVDLRYKSTFDGCQNQPWSCISGNCGTTIRSQSGIIDYSWNAAPYNRQWCESETIVTRHFSENKPFTMRENSCCWISTRNTVGWSLLTEVDFGSRSDTGQPNRPPKIATLPFLRTPMNCPRAYNISAFDPDGDQVRCRYGTTWNMECSSCNQPTGFYLKEVCWSRETYKTCRTAALQDRDCPPSGFEVPPRATISVKKRSTAVNGIDVTRSSTWLWSKPGTCTLHYGYTPTKGSYGFELVVEDFPKHPINLAYTNGSQSYRAPLTTRRRRKRQAMITPTSAIPWWQTTTTPPSAIPWWYLNTTPPSAIPWWYLNTTTPSAIPWWYLNTTSPSAIPWWQMTTAVTTPILYASTPPISKLPLQFSFFVDEPAPSCQEGEYLPRLIDPTPRNGQHLYAELHRELGFRVKAQATHSVINNIIISGPLNITKHTVTNDEFVIMWTPVSLVDMGEHFPICFIVESAVGSAMYQSEMRCVVVEVGGYQGKPNVICAETTMTVEVHKSTFGGVGVDYLRLNDPGNTACNLQIHSNDSHVIAVIPLNACGTEIEEDNENLIFKNIITSYDNVNSGIITRKHMLEVAFNCQYPKKSNVTLGFSAHRSNVTVNEKGFGTFTYMFEFYQSNQFTAIMDPSSYPLEFDLGDMIYMEIKASSSVNSTELFVESCSAAPYDIPNYRPTYPIIENGCIMDQTVEVYTPNRANHYRFAMEAFKFIGQHDQIYISCSVILCEARNPSSRCFQGCINSTYNGQHNVRKRHATIQTGEHFISQGPLRLRRTTEKNVLILNMNVVFIAGCLLAAVAMVCSVVIYKANQSKFKYQPLPSSDSEASVHSI